jgi:beta-glucosidase
VLFGDYNPGGRLPITFYKSVEQLPPFEDYNIAGRTYRYFTGQALYPFGYGLSYTNFRYENLRVEPAKIQAGDSVEVQIEVVNVGDVAGEEVVQLYLRDVESSVPVPLKSLQGFKRIFLKPGEKQEVIFQLKPDQMVIYGKDYQKKIEPGEFEVLVGGNSQNGVTANFRIVP